MDKETAITEARQRFKDRHCRPDSCSVPPLNPQRTNFNSELIVSPHRFAIPFREITAYNYTEEIDKRTKNVHLLGPVSVCLSEQKEKPRSYAGLFQRGHERGRERPRLMVDEALGPRQITHHSALSSLRQSRFQVYANLAFKFTPISLSSLRQSRFRFYAGNTADDCISIFRNHKKLQESSKKGIRKPARKKGEDRAG
ncbi:hypothetical protein [Bifidobacterium pseudocatenulatum]|uniref:hypothetical protein n=1 Tax=Bifidobacterium pseudocatenulatum TaxID=28026 RepID=UPI0015FB30A5|nr:hypothetical protein [Bifidobacterium pseudocatenulatum]